MSTVQAEQDLPDSSLQLRQYVELTVAGSGIFFVFLYSAGRLYLHSYFAAFNVDVQQLELSVQDVMFASLSTIIYPLLALLSLAALVPSALPARSLISAVSDYRARSQAARERHVAADLRGQQLEARSSSIMASMDEFKAKLEESQADDEAAQRRVAQVINTELKETFEPMRQRLRADLDAWKEELASVREEFETLEARGSEALRLSSQASLLDQALAVLLNTDWRYWLLTWAASCLVSFIIWISSDSGWRSALLRSLSWAAVFGTTILVFWLLFHAFTKTSRTGTVVASVITAIVLTVLVLPAVGGSLSGYGDRLNTDAGDGLPKVVVMTRRQMRSDWNSAGPPFESPPLRLLGRTGDAVLLWDPAHPDGSIEVPESEILLIERR